MTNEKSPVQEQELENQQANGQEQASATQDSKKVQTSNDYQATSESQSDAVSSIEDAHDEHAQEDYGHLSLDELLQEAQKLTKEENIIKAERKVRQLYEEVKRINQEKREEARKKFIEQGGEPDAFEYKTDEKIEKFFAYYKEIKDKKAKHLEKMQKDREDNLKAKRLILEEIKNLTESPDQKGVLQRIKELQQAWKRIGAVPQAEAEDLYNSYHAVLDRFYDRKGIEYELKQLDRQKNLAAKKELCERAERLLEHENLNEAVTQLNALHEEYKSIGPVPQEESEALWMRFKAASDKIYEKKRIATEELKKQLRENMVAKQQLCVKIEAYASFTSEKIKEWNEKTKEVQELQKEWEKIGPLPKEVAKDINKQFWSNFKAFFANKSAFFEKLDAERMENLKKKEAIIAEVEQLLQSENIKEATQRIIQLQEEWKKIGSVPEPHRETLYEKFKNLCDTFFENKRNKAKSKENDINAIVKKKRDVIEKINAITKETFNLEKLQQLKDEYFAAGSLPPKEANQLLDRFIVAIDKALDKSPLDITEREKQKMEFKAQLSQEVPQLSRYLSKQEQSIRKKIAELEESIALWENNLMFFANSKAAEKLRQDYQVKIQKARQEIVELKELLKQVAKNPTTEKK